MTKLDALCRSGDDSIQEVRNERNRNSSQRFGLTTAQAQTELMKIKSLFRFLPDVAAIYTEWEKLVAQHSVSGKNRHDARLAAAMKVHGLTHLLTFNSNDFKRFSAVLVIYPATVTPFPIVTS